MGTRRSPPSRSPAHPIGKVSREKAQHQSTLRGERDRAARPGDPRMSMKKQAVTGCRGVLDEPCKIAKPLEISRLTKNLSAGLKKAGRKK